MDRIAFRVAEVAAALGLGRSKTYELISQGEIPSIRIGGSIRVTKTGLDGFLERKQRGK